MSQISDGIGVAAILKNNQYIRFESGLDNEYQVELSRYTTLFKNASDIESVIEGIKNGFVGRGNKDPQEFWKYFKGLGDIEGFKRFSNDLTKIGIDQISQIILWTDEDQLTWRAYRWITYTLLTNQVSPGSACSKMQDYYAEKSAWEFISEEIPNLKDMWEEKPQRKATTKYNNAFWRKFEENIKNLESRENREDGFYVYDNIIYDYSYSGNLDYFKHGEDDFTIPTGIIGMKGGTQTGGIIFNAPGSIIETFTMTTDLQYLNSGDFFINGINNLKVINSQTGELLFQTNAFKDGNLLLCEREKFIQFCDLLPTGDWKKIQALFKKSASASSISSTKHKIELDEKDRIEIPFPYQHYRNMLKNEYTDEYVIHEHDYDYDYHGKSLYVYTGDAEVLSLPEDIEYIEKGAFAGSKALKKITFSYPVIIEEGAFEYCTNLEEIIIDTKVSARGEGIFKGCTSVKKVIVTDSASLDYTIINSFYEDLSDAAFNYSMGGYYIGSETNPYRLLVKFNDKLCTKTTIPSETEHIFSRAFRGCELIQSIVIEEGLSAIDDSLFRGCTSLKYIKLPFSITNIEPRAFCECSSLETITIPQSVKKIAKDAFSACQKLKTVTISDGAEYIGDLTFANCENLKYVIIPDSVKRIRSNSFENSPNVVIVSNSEYAERYAKKNNIAYQHSSADNLYKKTDKDTKTYGYTVADNKGGRPKADHASTIEELKHRYPNGANFKNVDELMAANPDIAKKLATLQKDAQQVLGMSFGKWLKSVGLMGGKAWSVESESNTNETTTLQTAHDQMYDDAVAKLRRIREDNERRVREDQERQAKEETERRAREEAERKVREEEAFRRAQAAATGNAIEEAYRKAQEDAERRKREVAERNALEAERKAREEAERKKREEIERICREAEERRLRAEAERKAQEEAERLARESERKAREEAERKAREEEERKAKEEAERKEREKERRKAAREEAKRKAREEEEQRAREEAERKAREEAERLEQERIRAERRAKKLCQHCGGKFKGLFTKKCSNCGMKKDY